MILFVPIFHLKPSSGECIGIDRYFPLTFLKAEVETGFHLPQKGRVFVDVPSLLCLQDIHSSQT